MNSYHGAICADFQDRKKEPPRASRFLTTLLGADELVALCEWQFRNRPFQLGIVRGIYARCCADLTLALETRLR